MQLPLKEAKKMAIPKTKHNKRLFEILLALHKLPSDNRNSNTNNNDEKPFK